MKRTLPTTTSSPSIDLWAAVPERFPRAVTTSNIQPATDMQALMQSAPGSTVAMSQESTVALRELLAAVIEMLPPLERRVIEALYIEMLSLRQAGRRFGRSKTTIARIRDSALGTMRDLLTDNSTITERLHHDYD